MSKALWLSLAALVLIGAGVGYYEYETRGTKPTGPAGRIPAMLDGKLTGQYVAWNAERAAVDTYGPRYPEYYDLRLGVFHYTMPDGSSASYLPVEPPSITS